MDEDIRFTFIVLGATGGDTTFTFPVPYKCTVRGLTCSVSADPGDGETVTVTNATQSTNVGVMAMGSTIAANALGTWTKDATAGDYVQEKDDVFVFVISTLTAAAYFSMVLELDPKARIP